MYHLTREYLERSNCARTPEQLRDAVSAVVAPIDLFAFAFLALPESGKPLLISTYPVAWTGHYIAQGYQSRDPVMLQSRRVFNLFAWNPQMAKKFGPGARDFFCEAEAFDIRCGVTVPIHNWPGGPAAMTFATDRGKFQYATCLNCNAMALLLIAFHFNNQLRALLEPVRQIEGATLTAREYECLKWTARGKSSTDIAQIMNVSHRIIARDLERIRSKLGVRSVQQAAAVFASYETTRTLSSHWYDGA